MVNITECSTKDCNNMSIDGIDGRCNECLQPILEVEEPDYETAFHILMEYYDFIPEEEREAVDEELKECGL